MRMSTKDFEQTLVLIKPDALKNSLTGYVLSQLSEFHTGLCLAGMKIVRVSRMLAEEHYVEHKGKNFFPSLLDYIRGYIHNPVDAGARKVIAIVYQGPDAVKKIRDLAGPTNPLVAREQRPGCIRALGTLAPIKDANGEVIDQRMDNLIHASATDEEAQREIKLWFKPHDIPPAMHCYATEICDTHYYWDGNTVSATTHANSIGFLSPGNIVWKSDLDALKQLSFGSTTSVSLESILAKYLINEAEEA